MTKKIFFSLASAALLVSCSDELQLSEQGQVTTFDGINGKLVKAGFLAGARDNSEATRATTPKGSFVWMAEIVADGTTTKGTYLNLPTTDPDYSVVPTAGSVVGNYPQLGLCWTGVDPITGEDTKSYGAIDAPEDNVFTNYLYEQVGWIKQGDKELDWNECTGEVYNGAFYQGYTSTPAAHYAGTLFNASLNSYGGVQSQRGNKYYYAEPATNVVEGEFTYEGADTKLNLGNGIFTTENSSVFQGQYIVYFPYNGSFKKGPIVADMKDHFNIDIANDKYAAFSANSFQLGLLPDYSGIESGQGREVAFTTKNYSSTALIQLYNGYYGGDKYIKSVILYSPTEGLTYKAGISAKSVVEAINANDMSLVKQMQDENLAHTHAIYADLKNGSTPYVTVDSWYHSNPSNAIQIAIPVLPQEKAVSDLQVIIVYKDYTTASVSFSGKSFPAGGVETLNVNLDDVTPGQYIAYNEPSLAAILNTIQDAGGTVKLIRPIDLEKDNDDLYNKAATIQYSKNITLTSNNQCTHTPKCADACLTVKSETTRNIESTYSDALFKIDVPVIVEGYGCCADYAAVLNLGGTNIVGTATDKITLTKTLTNYGTTNVGNTTSRSTVTLADVENIRDTEYVKSQISKNGKKYSKGSFDRKDILATTVPVVPMAAKLNFLAPGGNLQNTYVKGNINNEGSVVFSAESKYTTGNSDGNRANYIEVGSITNKGFLAAGSANATAETDLAGGDIVVKAFALVHVKKNVVNTEKYAYIHTEVETPGEAHSATTDGRLDIYNEGSTSSNSGTIENHGVINLLGSTHLQNQEKGLFIDRVNGQVGGLYVENGTKLNAAATDANYNEIYYRGIEDALGLNKYSTDVKPGIYCTEVNTLARLSKVLKDPVQQKSCVVIDIIDNTTVTDPETYELKSLSAAQLNVLKEKDVRFSNPTVVKNSTKNSDSKYSAVTEIGHCIDVKANVTLDEGNTFNVYNNVLVREGAILNMTANAAELHVGDAANTVNGKNVYVFGNGQLQTVKATGSFVSSPRLYVGHDLVVKDAAGIVNLGDGASTANNNRVLYVVNDVNNAGKVYSDKKFWIGNDYVGKAGSNLDSDGDNNTVVRNFELWGDAQFAPNTTTTIEGTFNSKATASVFTREELGGDPDSRSTVNCNILGTTTGHAVGGWPTQYGDM